MGSLRKPPRALSEQPPVPAQQELLDTSTADLPDAPAPGLAASEDDTPAARRQRYAESQAVTSPLTPLEPDDDEEAAAVDSTQPLHPLLAEYAPYLGTDLSPQTPPTDPIDPDADTHILTPTQMPSISLHRSTQGLAFAARRDVGRMRQMNQDSVLGLLLTLPREANDVPLGLFVVADGMGGHDGGEVASRLAVRTVLHEVLAQLVLPAMDDDPIEALQPLMISAVQEANRTIWEHAHRVGSDMGTTCTAALLLGQALYIAHVGDSRAYLLEAGGLRLLTTDHSTVGRLIQMGRLPPEEARTHPLRNQLYRTIGQQPQVQIDFTYQPVGNSSHLLVCSDGLWGMVPEDQLTQALTHSPWPQDVCEELIALANLAGGEDNISAVVVTLPIAERLHG